MMQNTHSYNGIDVDLDMEMVIVIPIYLFALMYHFFSMTLYEPMDNFFKDTLFSPGGVEITGAILIALLALTAIVVNRDRSLRETKAIDAWIVYATGALIIAPPIHPILEDTIATAPANIFSFTAAFLGIFIASALN